MNNEILSKLAELIEHCGEASKLVTLSEISLNDGELQESQKSTQKAVDMLKTMTKDIFLEVVEVLEVENDGKNSDPDISALNLAYALNDVCYNTGVLLNMYAENQDERIISIAKIKLVHAINDVTTLFETLYM